jgi:two-component system, LuxR family, response regulator FixJ
MRMPTERPTVFVVDDDVELCNALAWLFQAADLRVETYYSAEDFEQAYGPQRVGCLVLDVRMRGMSGLELQARLNARHSHLPIIILTAHADVPLAVRALKAGAVTLLEKPVSDEVLIAQVRAAIARDEQQAAELEQRDAVRELLASLTGRERQVKDFVIVGLPNKQIAANLGIAEKTVEVHRKHLMRKLRAKSVADLVRICMLADEQRPRERAFSGAATE